MLVVGAARSGVAAAALAARRGAEVTLTEMRETFDAADRLRTEGVHLELGGHTVETFTSADLIVTSPGVPVEQPVFDAARARDVEIIGELEFAWRFVKGPVIAITGTKGKSTTTTLIGRMLEAAGRKTLVGGNIGTPLSAQVDQSTSDTIHVVETSSFQLETTTTFHPWIAVWLNFAADHLDRHPSEDAYAAAKARIFANQNQNDWAVLNADDHEVIRRARGTSPRQVLFSLEGVIDDGFVVDGAEIVHRTGTDVERLIPVAAVELTGRHMLNNVLAAVAAIDLAGVRPQSMLAALRGFHGLPHVMEPVGEIASVRFVNDSKATNADSAAQALACFENIFWIAGGKPKTGGIASLARFFPRIRKAYLIGEAAAGFAAELDGRVPHVTAGTLDRAVELAAHDAEACGLDQPVVLLSPACASFDQYRNFEIRGDKFRDLVRALPDLIPMSPSS